MTTATPSESELRERLESKGMTLQKHRGGGYKVMDVMNAHHHYTATSEKNLEDVEAFLHGYKRGYEKTLRLIPRG